MKLNIRKVNEKDFINIDKWWIDWQGKTVPREILPETGFIAEIENKPISAIFMFKTNSSTAAIQWVVSDKNYREENRNKVLQELIKTCEEEWKTDGGKFLFFWGNNKKFNNTLVDIGFKVGDTDYDQLIKSI